MFYVSLLFCAYNNNIGAILSLKACCCWCYGCVCLYVKKKAVAEKPARGNTKSDKQTTILTEVSTPHCSCCCCSCYSIVALSHLRSNVVQRSH